MKRPVVPERVLWPAVLFLVFAQAVFVAAYVGAERTIYFWDHAMYLGMARQAYAVFGQSLGNYWAMFQASLANNYNLIFTLPSLVTFSLFGISRGVFIVTNFLVFFLLYEVAVAVLLRRALGMAFVTALLVSLLAAVFTPPLWLPLLEGYPDNGAAACLVFAAVIGWGGAIEKRFIWRALGIGFFLGLAVLLRRHFVYPAIAELLALGCLELWDIACDKKNRWPKLQPAAIYFFVCGIAFAGTLVIVAPDFLKSALTVNYSQLYLSYQRPALVFLFFILGGFGYGLLLAATGGLVLLARSDEAGKKLALFTVLFTLFWLVIWCLGPDQMGHHYILHTLPLFVAAGLTGWFVSFQKQTGAKKYLIGVLGVLLAANSAWALWFSPTGVWPNNNGMPGILSAARPPVVRPDYDEWHRLAEYLVRTTKPDDRIMVVGSSFVLNLDLLHNVFMDLPDGAGMDARFNKNPEIDHEEPPPFDIFAGSNVYIVPAPAQYHLDPSGQRVVTAAANQFPPHTSHANLFHADDEAFHLADGVVVKIWRRGTWTPLALHDALGDIRRDGPQDSNFAQEWAAIALPLRERINTNSDHISSAAALLDSEHREFRMFFDYPLEPGAYRLAYSYATDCAAPAFRLKTETGTGKTGATKDITAYPGQPQPASADFTVPQAGTFLELGFSANPAALCRVELRDLRVEQNH